MKEKDLGISTAISKLLSGQDANTVITESIKPEAVSSDILSYQNLLDDTKIKELALAGDTNALTEYLKANAGLNLTQRRYRRIAAFLIYQATFFD